jgi:MFS family permease
MRYVLANRLLIVLLGIGIVTAMLTSPFSYLLPVMVVDVYKLESESYGLLVSSMGLGAVISGLVVASLGRWRRGLILALGILVAGVCMMLVSLIPIYAAAIVILWFKGLGGSGPMALKQALVIEHVDDRFRGRVISFMSLNMGLTPLALIPAGFMIDLLNVRIVIAMIAALTLAVFAVLVTTQRRVIALQ